MSDTAKKARFSKKNLLIPFFGIFIMISVFGLMNSQWISAQAINKFNLWNGNEFLENGKIEVMASEHTSPTIVIPKLGVEAPIVVDVLSRDEKSVQAGLKNGVLHYGNTANPGEKGNVVLFGHSSGQIWTAGNYKFIFTLLNTVHENDRIYIDYNNIRYIYLVTETKVVPPTDFSVVQPTDFPQLTLITCTPAGTNKDRLVVHAKQLIPSPDSARPANPASQLPITSNSLPR